MESSSFSGSSKRAKAPGNITQQLIHCSVDGCNADLSLCKEYHRRHKVCEIHSKTAKVNVAGREQRFCQQCSRFHSLVEFDEGKRSCRKRLDGHNRRRRKPQPTGADSSSSLVLSSQQLGLGSGGTLLSFSTSTSPQRLVPLPTTRSSSNWAMKTDQNDMLLYNYNMERQNECSSAHRSYKQGGLNQFQFIQNTDHHHHHHHHQPLLHPINAHHQQLVVDSDHGALSLLSSAAPPATREFGLNHQDFVPHQQSSIVNYAPGALGHHGDHYPFAQESINKPLVSSADDSHHQMFHHHRPADGSSSSTTTTSTNTASHQTLKFTWE